MYTSKAHFNTMPKSLGGIFEDIFQNGFSKILGEDTWNDGVTAPVNIYETESAYRMDVMAPGLKKEDFKLNVDRNVLHVSYDHKDENKEANGKMLRKEYKMQTFRRSFTLNDKINVGGISAKYSEGVLTVTLPKKEQTEPGTQEITID